MKRVDVRTYRKCHQLVTLRKKKVQPAATSGFCWYIPEHHETAEIVNGNAAILFEVGEILYQLRSREGKHLKVFTSLDDGMFAISLQQKEGQQRIATRALLLLWTPCLATCKQLC